MNLAHKSFMPLIFGLGLLAYADQALAAEECRTPTATAAESGYQTATHNAADGICLRWFSWAPQQVSPRGVVIITHGIRDHALRYEKFARRLSDRGYAVFAQDLRGHGHSGGERQRFDSLDQLVADQHQIVTMARQRFPDLPLYLYGHSLGGLVTTEYVIAHPEKLNGVVLSGAAFERPASVAGVSVFLARIVAALAPGLNVVAVDDREFSRDPATMSAMVSDTLITRDKLPAISAVASINGMQHVKVKSSEITVPLLVMYGTDDKVNPVGGSRAFLTSVGSRDKTLKEFQGLYHDMLHEPEHVEVEAEVINWLHTR